MFEDRAGESLPNGGWCAAVATTDLTDRRRCLSVATWMGVSEAKRGEAVAGVVELRWNCRLHPLARERAAPSTSVAVVDPQPTGRVWTGNDGVVETG